MIQYHAVMKDETGCEFGVTFKALDKDHAHEILRDDYPESRCVQLEDEDDTEAREEAMWNRVRREEEDGFYYEDALENSLDNFY